MKKFISKWRFWHFILLPIFFILHINNFYFGLIPIAISLKYLFAYLLLSIITFFISKWIFKKLDTTVLFSFCLLFLFFSFGTIKDYAESFSFLKKILSYKIILPFIAIALSVLLLILKRTKRKFNTLHTFIFLAILANTMIEVFLFCYKTISGADKENELGDADKKLEKSFVPCNNCEQPDVYYIIFDEFTSNNYLKQRFNFSNDTLQNYFKRNNFFVAQNSHSNYFLTYFSLASVFEMNYLNFTLEDSIVSAKYAGIGNETLWENAVCNIFEKQGYLFHNYSTFDFKNHSTHQPKYFENLPESFITHETLYGRTNRDIGWNIPVLFINNKREKDSVLFELLKNTEGKSIQNSIDRAFEGIKLEDPNKKDFFYFHFMLPHFPYIFKSNGGFLKFDTASSVSNYVEHVKFTTNILIKFVDEIFKRSNRKAVIIIQGDHGLRNMEDISHPKESFFKNLNAVFLPDGNYSSYYDGVSSVNTFRLLFNHYFKTNYPLLKDEMIFKFHINKKDSN